MNSFSIEFIAVFFKRISQSNAGDKLKFAVSSKIRAAHSKTIECGKDETIGHYTKVMVLTISFFKLQLSLI